MRRDKNIVEAVALLPEELLTGEIIEAAAARHNPALLEYLPPKYRTPEIIETIFEQEGRSWERWSLERIPEECRTYNICLRAVGSRKENLRFVPVPHRTPELLREALDNRDVLHLLPLVPVPAWNRELAYVALNRIASSVPYRESKYDTERTERAAQVLLSFVPHGIRNVKFYLGMLEQEVLPPEMALKITPRRFQTRRFQAALATADYKLIASDKYDRELFRAALFSPQKQAFRIMRNTAYRERLCACLDEELADRIAAQSPHDFNLLPPSFRTSQRLLLALESLPDGGCNGFELKGKEDERLLTAGVCRALVRKCGYDLPQLPARVWNQSFATYCAEHAASSRWIEQAPRHLISWQIGTKIYEQATHLIGHLPKRMITPERAQALCREDFRYMEDIPQHYLTEFSRYTGLPAEFYGRQVSLAALKESKASFHYCRIGTTYIGLYKTDSYHNDSYRLMMTRAANRYIGAEQVFDKPVGTFHRTWLEKLVAENDPLFRKPKVDAALRDVQAVGYYGVELLRTAMGASFYRNTFMGEAVGYCIRKAGMTYHDDSFDELIPGWRKKWEQMHLTQNDDPTKKIDADTLHRRLGYCRTGIAAFAQDYGLDPKGSYTVAELRERIKQTGPKPSLTTYRWELQHIHII